MKIVNAFFKFVRHCSLFVTYISDRVFVNSKVRDYHTVSNFWPVANSYLQVFRIGLKMWTLKSRSNLWPVRSKIWTARCEHLDRLNFWTVKARLLGCVVTQLEDAILDLLKRRSAHGQMIKPLTKVKIQPGSTVPCQWETIERFLVNFFNRRKIWPVS